MLKLVFFHIYALNALTLGQNTDGCFRPKRKKFEVFTWSYGETYKNHKDLIKIIVTLLRLV